MNQLESFPPLPIPLNSLLIIKKKKKRFRSKSLIIGNHKYSIPIQLIQQKRKSLTYNISFDSSKPRRKDSPPLTPLLLNDHKNEFFKTQQITKKENVSIQALEKNDNFFENMINKFESDFQLIIHDDQNEKGDSEPNQQSENSDSETCDFN